MYQFPRQIFEHIRNWLLTSSLTWSQMNGGRDTTWTPELKRCVGVLGEELGHVPIYTGCPSGEPEYLADIVWRLDEPRTQVYMSAESELSGNKNDILYDFRKLMDIKSEYNLGIFRLNSDREKELLNDMCTALRKQIGSMIKEYFYVLFIRYDREKKEIILSMWDVSKSGDKYDPIADINLPFPET